jgi:hypothetical protein
VEVDPAYLSRHYESLSDEALLAINRSDLVEIAQKCLGAELDRRGLAQARSVRQPEGSREGSRRPDGPVVRAAEVAVESGDPGEPPEWLEEAAEVYSRADPRAAAAPDMEDARDALEAAGIPCYLEFSEIPEEKSSVTPATHQWRLLVPGDLSLRATSILERDIFN